MTTAAIHQNKTIKEYRRDSVKMITTNFNPSVLTTQRNLNNATNSLNTALERMSTGYKVNCAADDAAGMFVASTLNANIRGLRQAQKMLRTEYPSSIQPKAPSQI